MTDSGDVAARIVEGNPTPAEYNMLRTAVGWDPYDEAVIAQALPATRYGVLTYLGDELVGMARVIGDGGMVYYVQDVIVLPEYQRNSLGRQMMDRIMGWVAENAHKNTIVGLMAAIDREGFYEPYGFRARPNATQGAGMIIFWPPDGHTEE